MLPHAYQLPAALLLVFGGALSCFAGYRLFKMTLAIYGFILGSMLASSSMGLTNTTGMIVAAVLGGIAGAIVCVFAYFIGIALVGAGLGAVIAHVGWGYLRAGDPPVGVLIAMAVAGAVGAMFLQRYVIIVATAFAGSWTVIVGGMAIATRGVDRASRLGDVWILYPTTPAPGETWVPFAWMVLGLAGMVVQLRFTGRRK